MPKKATQTPSKESQNSQYFTPPWAAEALLDRFLPELLETNPSFRAIEPSCGKGAFLLPIPKENKAIGIELDPDLIEEAKENTGREILCGNFINIPLPSEYQGNTTHIIGNPPFTHKTFEEFLNRAKSLLIPEGTAGFILPAYFFQTTKSVLQWHQTWNIEVELIPRDLFPGLSLPLCFSKFHRNPQTRKLIGLFLYQEHQQIKELPKETQNQINNPKKGPESLWKGLLKTSLEKFGGKASISHVLNYLTHEELIPTTNNYPREKIRQTLQRYPNEFLPLGNGEWSLNNATQKIAA